MSRLVLPLLLALGLVRLVAPACGTRDLRSYFEALAGRSADRHPAGEA